MNMIKFNAPIFMQDFSKNIAGYSLPLCLNIIEALMSRQEKFHIKTLCVLQHNTKRVSGGNTFPIVSGVSVSLFPNQLD